MKRNNIVISETGSVSMPENVQMRPFEIAALFGVYVQTVNANIKTVLKSGVVAPDIGHGAIVSGDAILPEFYGLDMVTALAFRIHSRKAEEFREWIMHKKTAGVNPSPAAMFIRLPDNALPN